jgi:hypothetical protein
MRERFERGGGFVDSLLVVIAGDTGRGDSNDDGEYGRGDDDLRQ